MAQLFEGKWVATAPAAEEVGDGSFERKPSSFRGTIAEGGAFPPEAGRYHLFVAYSCPWASRALAVRAIKTLEEIVTVSVATRGLGSEGWTFETGPHGEPGPFALHRIYTGDTADYTGKVTVPTLWDRHTGRIVNNESSEIIRILNSAFDGITGDTQDLYPVALRSEIDRWNDDIYANLNNGVYRAGFASDQAAYEDAAWGVFACLDRIEAHLAEHRYLAGDTLTEADWRLFVTLVRFEVGYHGAFKCNLRRLEDYPNASAYLRELYQWPGIAATVRLDEIKAGYWALTSRNPTVPIGPQVDFTRPHDRERLPGRGISRR